MHVKKTCNCVWRDLMKITNICCRHGNTNKLFCDWFVYFSHGPLEPSDFLDNNHNFLFKSCYYTA
uniref:Uncharacterized protein n=1 Tax=Arundo donax TaxID=35708 RepID=A0A0A9EFF7_ARUDO